MKRVNFVWGACESKVRRLAARGGKLLRLLLVDGPLAHSGGGGARFGLREGRRGRGGRIAVRRAVSVATRNPWPKEPQPMLTGKFVCTLCTSWTARGRNYWSRDLLLRWSLATFLRPWIESRHCAG